jgi:hypothetical protein
MKITKIFKISLPGQFPHRLRQAEELFFIEISFKFYNPSVPPKRDISPKGENVYVFL